MDLNAMIAQGTQFKVPDLLGQAAQIQQLQQGAQSNQLNQMKMQEVQRGLQEQEGLRNYLRSGADLTAPGARLEFLKHGQTGLAYGKSLDEAKKAELEREKIGTDLIDARLKQSRLMLEGVSTPEDYLRWHEANHTDPVLGKYLASRGVTAETSRARIMQALNTPGGFEQMLNQSKLGAEKAMEQHFIESSSGRQKWTSTVPKYGAGVAPAQIIPGTIVNQVTTPGEQLQAETTRRGQDITAGTAAAALSQARNLPLQEALAGAKAKGEGVGKYAAEKTEPLTPKEIQTREAAHPQATLAVTNVTASLDQLKTQLETLKTHKGLPGITGAVGGRLPSASPDSIDAQAVYDTATASGALAALQALRDASKTGGALGNTSDADMALLKNSIGALSRVQTTKALKSNIDLAIKRLDDIKTRTEAAYKETYKYKQPASPHAAKTDAQIKAELGL